MSWIDTTRGSIERTVRERRRRFVVYAVIVVLLGLLSFWPPPYVARAKILPQENGSAAGLGSMINVLSGQLNDYSALLGQRNSIETYLIVARSNEVSLAVIREMNLVGPNARYDNVADATEDLFKKVDVHSLLGGVMEIEAQTHDSAEAQSLATAYLHAINDRIGSLSRRQVSAKRELVANRLRDATQRVTQTSVAFNAFRQRYRLAEPEAQFGAALSQRTGLEATLKAKQVQLQTLQQFQGAGNVELQELQAEIGALQRQLAGSIQPEGTAAGPNLAALTGLQNQYLNLYRDYRFAQTLFDLYSRFNEQVDLQELAAASGADVQVIEAPHLDPERHFNVAAVALLGAVVLMIVFVELYMPVTGLLPSQAEAMRRH